MRLSLYLNEAIVYAKQNMVEAHNTHDKRVMLLSEFFNGNSHTLDILEVVYNLDDVNYRGKYYHSHFAFLTDPDILMDVVNYRGKHYRSHVAFLTDPDIHLEHFTSLLNYDYIPRKVLKRYPIITEIFNNGKKTRDTFVDVDHELPKELFDTHTGETLYYMSDGKCVERYNSTNKLFGGWK